MEIAAGAPVRFPYAPVVELLLTVPTMRSEGTGAATGEDLADLNRRRLDNAGLEIEIGRWKRRSGGDQEYGRSDGPLLRVVDKYFADFLRSASNRGELVGRQVRS